MQLAVMFVSTTLNSTHLNLLTFRKVMSIIQTSLTYFFWIGIHLGPKCLTITHIRAIPGFMRLIRVYETVSGFFVLERSYLFNGFLYRFGFDLDGWSSGCRGSLLCLLLD